MKQTKKQLEERIKGLEEEVSGLRAREHVLKQRPFVIPTAAAPGVMSPMRTYMIGSDGSCVEVVR